MYPVVTYTSPWAARGRGAPSVMRFDHGARAAEFTSLLARARARSAARQPVGPEACTGFETGERDRDNDGLADRFDAAPDDRDEFVADRNGDGLYEICFAAQLQASEIGAVKRLRGATAFAPGELQLGNL